MEKHVKFPRPDIQNFVPRGTKFCSGWQPIACQKHVVATFMPCNFNAMQRTILCALAGFTVCLSTRIAFADEETCVACDRKVLVSGQFEHGRGHESLAVQGAPKRGEEAFREEIYGSNFTVSVPNLPAGKYTVLIGLAEIVFTNAGQRAFENGRGHESLAIQGAPKRGEEAFRRALDRQAFM